MHAAAENAAEKMPFDRGAGVEVGRTRKCVCVDRYFASQVPGDRIRLSLSFIRGKRVMTLSVRRLIAIAAVGEKRGSNQAPRLAIALCRCPLACSCAFVLVRRQRPAYARFIFSFAPIRCRQKKKSLNERLDLQVFAFRSHAAKSARCFDT